MGGRELVRARNKKWGVDPPDQIRGVARVHSSPQKMEYDHEVLAVFNPGDATGFVYTTGMHPKFELFALDVP